MVYRTAGTYRTSGRSVRCRYSFEAALTAFCAFARGRIAFPRKNIKKSEKALDIPPLIQYDNQVRVVGLAPPADTAMNREIAPQGGNFRGVCPIIGRLRNPDAA